jgi:PAS domain S-box-containing protein
LQQLDRTPGDILVQPPTVWNGDGLHDRQFLALIAVERTRMPMVITDPRQPDNPIILANQAFLDMSGYTAEEVIGRNCRFLQGPATSKAALELLRRAVADERATEVELLNYRRDGTTFWNQLYVSPVHDETGALTYFFASQKDITERRDAQSLRAAEHRLLREVDHRAMNALALVQGIGRLSRADTAAAYAAAVQSRVSALARAHTLLSRSGWGDISLAQVLRDELESYGERMELDGPEIPIPPEQVQPLFLLIAELLSNAVAHGALSAPGGGVTVSWRASETGVEIHWVERGAAPKPAGAPGFGTRMIDSIAKQQLRGAVARNWRDDGLSLEMTFPKSRAASPADVA